jgi:hypothetical protein
MRLFLELVLAIAALQAMPAAQAPSGSMRVTVNVAGTTRPLAGAKITLASALTVARESNGASAVLESDSEDFFGFLTEKARQSLPSSQPVRILIGHSDEVLLVTAPEPYVAPTTVLTDNNGVAEFRNLPNGRYRIVAGSEGYLGNITAENFDHPPRSALLYSEITSADPVRQVSLSLTPGSTITGRVIDSNGKPVVDATVTIFVQKTLQPTGRSYLSPGQQARTNSSGVYRLTTLAPGEYYIATTNSKIRFYPSAGEAEQATRVLVRGGEEITGIDVRVPEER